MQSDIHTMQTEILGSQNNLGSSMGNGHHSAGVDTMYGGYESRFEGRAEGRYEGGRYEGRSDEVGGMTLSYEEKEKETLPTRHHVDGKSDGAQPQQRFGQLEQRLEDTMEEVAR